MNDILNDLYRFTGSSKKKILLKTFICNSVFRQIFYYRIYNKCTNLLGKKIIRFIYHFNRKRNGIDLPLEANIGTGLLLLHPQNITFNSQCNIGCNLTILKGATIGATKDENGNNLVPKIGNNVYIGINAVVIGNIEIGDNSIICANSFVNFNVPNDSIVLGNPGKIHYKKNASNVYIKNKIVINKSKNKQDI